jgi:hypothetical protein
VCVCVLHNVTNEEKEREGGGLLRFKFQHRSRSNVDRLHTITLIPRIKAW